MYWIQSFQRSSQCSSTNMFVNDVQHVYRGVPTFSNNLLPTNPFRRFEERVTNAPFEWQRCLAKGHVVKRLPRACNGFFKRLLLLVSSKGFSYLFLLKASSNEIITICLLVITNHALDCAKERLLLTSLFLRVDPVRFERNPMTSEIQ